MWLCSQLGAREHYAIPRALFRQGALDQLLTDAWAAPGSPLAGLSFGPGERFHPDLTEARVRAWNAGLLAFEMTARLKRLSGWPLIIARNQWFLVLSSRSFVWRRPERESQRQPRQDKDA